MDMLSLVVFTFYMPAFIRVGNNAIYYTLGFFNGVFENAPVFTHIINIIWFFLVFQFFFSPSVQFLYRYLIVCRQWKPSYRLYTVFYSLILLLLLSYAILMNGPAIYVSRTSNALYRDYIFTDNPTNADLMVVSSDPSNIWSTIILCFIEGSPLCITVVCGIKIWLHFRRHFRLVSDSNRSNQRMQRQVNYALFIQGGMPIIGHLSIIFGAIFLNYEQERTSFLLNFLPLVIMTLNPLLTIIMVDSYRRAVINLLLCKSANANVTTVSVVQSVRMSRL